MANQDRTKTAYQGVYFTESKSKVNGKPERIYYIRYRKGGKQIEEKAGRQFEDKMSPAKASQVRAGRINNKEVSNQEKRLEERKKRETVVWTVDRLRNCSPSTTSEILSQSRAFSKSECLKGGQGH